MNTYTKTCIVCPHCGAHTDSSIDHIEVGSGFGPWYCDECGGSYTGVANGAETDVHKAEGRSDPTLDLLVIEPQSKPVFFVMAGSQYSRGGKSTVEEEDHHKRFFYEEHSCPTNWIGDTILIANEGDTDPHGLFKFVRSVLGREMPEYPDDEQRMLVKVFPELTQNEPR